MPRVANSAKKPLAQAYKYEYTQASVHTDIGVQSLSQDEFDHDAMSTRGLSQEEEATLQPTLSGLDEERYGACDNAENSKDVANVANSASAKRFAKNSSSKLAGNPGKLDSAIARTSRSLIASDVLEGIDGSEAIAKKKHDKVEAGRLDEGSKEENNVEAKLNEVSTQEAGGSTNEEAIQVAEEPGSKEYASKKLEKSEEDDSVVKPSKDTKRAEEDKVEKTQVRFAANAKVRKPAPRRKTTGTAAMTRDGISEWSLVNDRQRRRNGSGKQDDAKQLKQLFGAVWREMSKKGWRYVKGTEFYIDFHYLAPGVKNPKEGILNETKFDDVTSFMQFVQRSCPKIFEKAKEEVIAAKATEAASPTPPPKSKRKPQRKSDGALLKKKRKVSKVTKPKASLPKTGPKADELWNCKWSAVWAVLKEEYGWFFRKGSGLVSWVYVRTKGKRLNIDYFEDIDEVYRYLQANKQDYEEVYKRLVVIPKATISIPAKPVSLKSKKELVKPRQKTATEVKEPAPAKAAKESNEVKLEWKATWKTLRSVYNWRYKAGSGLVSWYYIRTRLKGGKEKVDYFTSPDDVLSYLEGHREVYPDLFSPQEDDSDTESSSSEDEELLPPSPKIHETQNLKGRPLLSSAESLQNSRGVFRDIAVVLIGFSQTPALENRLKRSLEKEGCEGVLTDDVPPAQLDEGNMVCISRPSMIQDIRSFQLYAHGMPLVHYQWVLDSRKKQELLPWRRYELPVVRFANSKTYSFLKLRKNQLKSSVPTALLMHERALESLNVSILSEKSSTSKMLRRVASCAGAKVVETHGLYSSDLAKRPQYLLLDSSEKHKVYDKLTDMAKKRRCDVMSTLWLLESIVQGKPLKPKTALEESLQRNCWSRR